MFNIWDVLLRGLVAIVAWFAQTFFLPPGTSSGSVFNLLNFGWFFSSGIATVIELVGAALGTFNWWIPGMCFFVDMVLWGIQLAISIYLFIMNLIKKLPLL